MIEFDLFHEWLPINNELDRKMGDIARQGPSQETKRNSITAVQNALTAISYRSFSIKAANTFSNDLLQFTPDEAVAYHLFEKTGIAPEIISDMSDRHRQLLLKDELLVEAKELLSTNEKILIDGVGHRFYQETVSQILG